MRSHISPGGAVVGGLSAYVFLAACSGNAPESSRPIGDMSSESSAVQHESSPNGEGSGFESGASERCGETPRTLVDPAALFPATLPGESRSFIHIDVSTTDIYYAFDSNQNVGIDGAVMRVPLGGGPPSQLAAVQGRMQALLVTAAGVVFAQEYEDEYGDFAGQLVRVPSDGSPPIVLASTVAATTGTLATDGDSVYFADGEGTKSVPLGGGGVRLITRKTGTIAVVGTDVIIASTPPMEMLGSILSVPTNGGTPVELASNQPSPRLPQACGTDVCWITDVPGPSVIGGTGAIVRRSASGMPQTIIEDGSDGSPIHFIRQLLFDGTDFFGAEFNDLLPHEGTPFRLSAGGGTLVRLLPDGGSIAVDDRCVYMASSVEGITSVVKSYTPGAN
jgi:hypothetical protein